VEPHYNCVGYQGHLKVVGTQQHLKNKFGSGYLLQLNLLESSPERNGLCAQVASRRSSSWNEISKTMHTILLGVLDLQRVFSALYRIQCNIRSAPAEGSTIEESGTT
jgi:hypothetical protein